MAEENKTNPYLTAGAIVVTGMIIAGAVIYTNKIKTNQQLAKVQVPEQEQAQNQDQNQPKPEEPQKVDVSADDDAVMGEESAKVTIIEFSDFQCPFCGKFHQETFPQIKKDFVDQGKVKFVYRDYPLPYHSMAQKAAEAAECAKEQGKFWEMADKIFANTETLSVEELKKIAKELDLDTSAFDSCLDSGKYKEEVAKDVSDATSYGVQATPTFFINGKKIEGALPYTSFKQAIEQALNEAK